MSGAIWTVGHSTHSIEHFIELLRAAGVEAVADIRRFAGSLQNPQYSAQVLVRSLVAAGIDYRHFPSLGGRRRRRAPASPNRAWRVEEFNAYADHAQSEDFEQALTELVALARLKPTVVMCAEALPWRCHRRILADVLIARGWKVYDIMADGAVRPRQMTDFARVLDGKVTYPVLE